MSALPPKADIAAFPCVHVLVQDNDQRSARVISRIKREPRCPFGGGGTFRSPRNIFFARFVLLVSDLGHTRIRVRNLV
jgi:hypothetical protein